MFSWDRFMELIDRLQRLPGRDDRQGPEAKALQSQIRFFSDPVFGMPAWPISKDRPRWVPNGVQRVMGGDRACGVARMVSKVPVCGELPASSRRFELAGPRRPWRSRGRGKAPLPR